MNSILGNKKQYLLCRQTIDTINQLRECDNTVTASPYLLSTHTYVEDSIREFNLCSFCQTTFSIYIHEEYDGVIWYASFTIDDVFMQCFRCRLTGAFKYQYDTLSAIDSSLRSLIRVYCVLTTSCIFESGSCIHIYIYGVA